MPVTLARYDDTDMLKTLPILFAIIGTAVILLLSAILIFNSLIRKKNDVQNAFASIDVMLRKRYDLIPQIVDAVKAYMKYEKDLLTEITSLRVRAISRDLPAEDRVMADNLLGERLSDLQVAVENYPELKASANFLHLQQTLNETEEQLAASRRAFNAAVTAYNNGIEVFPSSIIASILNYRRKTLFTLPEETRKETTAKPPVNMAETAN